MATGALAVAAALAATSLLLPPPGADPGTAPVEPAAAPAATRAPEPAPPAPAPPDVADPEPIEGRTGTDAPPGTTRRLVPIEPVPPEASGASPDASPQAPPPTAPGPGAVEDAAIRPQTGPVPPARSDAAPAAPGRIALVPDAEVVVVPPAPPAAPVAAEPAPEPPEPPALPQRLVLDSAREAEDGPAGASATAFPPAGASPMLAIVLLDAEDRALAAPQSALDALDLPLTFALAPDAAGAGARAAALRAAGHEVALDPDGPVDGATAQDVEVALGGARAAVPGAVALVDDGPERFGTDPEALAAVLPALAAAGLGLVTPPGGLGAAVADARRAGVPAVAAYRVMDGAGERPEVIARYLDRATFEAAQAGPVVVLGRATADTVAGIALWASGDRAASVSVAPLSAVLAAAGGAGR